MSLLFLPDRVQKLSEIFPIFGVWFWLFWMYFMLGIASWQLKQNYSNLLRCIRNTLIIYAGRIPDSKIFWKNDNLFFVKVSAEW
jgi:hypothetical protein